ncbi:uncharacterized protein LOC128221758 [Mya arenaria]|uniref:uncharacterized protein LOC128221758 n=1 Tax=Mya arenaria TaxID=6604 RepID=UPI0022E3F946|nr:uncharacterized protein LOC128221758 [Mya arenaria]
MAVLMICFVTFSISYLTQVDALVCLQCKSVLSPRMCKRVTECGNGEVCKVQRHTNEFGETVFDLGCSSSTVCYETGTTNSCQKLLQINNVCTNVTSVSQQNPCTQCCDIDLCNHVACNEKDYPATRGPICYNCRNPTPAGKCHDVEFCDQDQICKVVASDVFGDTLYTSSCELQHTCGLQIPPGIIGKRDSSETRSIKSDHACDTCCSGDLCNRNCPPVDCSDVLNLGLSRGSGVYRVKPWTMVHDVEVYCDMDTEGGGWTVFQKRWNGSEDFNRSFVEYEQGFGSLDGEFWMDCLNQDKQFTIMQWTILLKTVLWVKKGLSLLHSMTSRRNMTLRVDMSLANGTTGFDEYSGFYISPPDQYNINVDKRVNSSGMSDSYLLSNTVDPGDINHQPFSTYDRDADKWHLNCAERQGGGWWFKSCTFSLLNGHYNTRSFTYFSFTDPPREQLKTSRMMFR